MSQPSMAKNKSGGIVETIKTIVYAMLIAIAIRTVIALSRHQLLPRPSAEPPAAAQSANQAFPAAVTVP